jgi:ABC-type branched-subunit amino acid transport system ATPase component
VNALEVEGLSGGYGPLVVFSGLNLTVAPNVIGGILGPNGVGKTTLLKTLAGLLKPQGGSVQLFGKNVVDQSAHRRARQGLVLVPEGRQIFHSLSVRENLDIPRAASGLGRHEFDQRRGETLALFPRLAERLDSPGGVLSGGEQQMLAIARALLLSPKLLMLDEPTQGLAPIMIGQVLECLERLRGQFSMLIVEQNVDFIEKLSNFKFTLRSGRFERTK